MAHVGALSDVVCPPYDVIDAEFQDRLYKQHPCNVIRLELNRAEPGDTDVQDKYKRAARFFRDWRDQGVLRQEPDPALYVYHQIFQWEGREYVRKGFLGRIRLERFGEGRVYPHEQTLSGPKQDRMWLLQSCQMNFSPIFGLFPDDGNTVQSPLERAIHAQPPVEATDHLGVIHRLWPVTDRAVIDQVRSLMADKPVFIADGHHRYETAVNYRDGLAAEGKLDGPDAPANFALMAFVGMSDPGLVIMPTHRLVSGFPGLTAAKVAEALRSHFDVEPAGSGPDAAVKLWSRIESQGDQDVFGFGTAADQQWLFAKVRDDSPMLQLAAGHGDDWRGLGVSLLHTLAIEHRLKSLADAGGPKFQYVHLTSEVVDAMEKKSCDLACLVPAADIGHVEAIASRLEKMPPKSTYFYPKLLTGMVFNPVS
jgi:uncharacterized protein (DUF1015 family)